MDQADFHRGVCAMHSAIRMMIVCDELEKLHVFNEGIGNGV